MRIKIEPEGFGTLKDGPFICDAKEIGLRYVENSKGRLYDVIDEQLFFLMVVEHGMAFTRLD